MDVSNQNHLREKNSESAVLMKSSSWALSLAEAACAMWCSISWRASTLKQTFLLGLLPLQYLLVMKFSIWSQSSSISGTLPTKHSSTSASFLRQSPTSSSITFFIAPQPSTTSLLHTRQNYLQYRLLSLQYLPTVFMVLLSCGKSRLNWFIRRQRAMWPSGCGVPALFDRENRYSYEIEGSLIRQELQLFQNSSSLGGFWPCDLAQSARCSPSSASQHYSSQSDILMAHTMIVYSLTIAASVSALCRQPTTCCSSCALECR